MAKFKKFITSPDNMPGDELTKEERLKQLLKVRLPGVFEREPAPAYKEGDLNALIGEILDL